MLSMVKLLGKKASGGKGGEATLGKKP